MEFTESYLTTAVNYVGLAADLGTLWRHRNEEVNPLKRLIGPGHHVTGTDQSWLDSRPVSFLLI